MVEADLSNVALKYLLKFMKKLLNILDILFKDCSREKDK